jgi:hypothetical protein
MWGRPKPTPGFSAEEEEEDIDRIKFNSILYFYPLTEPTKEPVTELPQSNQ